MDLLKGKCAVITGCNRGIGRAILEKFCSYGAEIFALVRKESEDFLNDIKKLSEKYQVSITPVYADFSDEDQVKNAAKTIISAK